MIKYKIDKTGDFVKLSDLNEYDIGWVEDLVDRAKGNEYQIKWINKHNKYIVYDYEPFCTKDFTIELTIEFQNIYHTRFFEFLLNERLQILNKLNKCLELY